MAETKPIYEGPTGVVVKPEYGYSRSYTTVDEEKRIVEVVHVSRCKDGLDVYMTTKFDYSNLDMSEILEIASRSSVIACRLTEFKNIPSAQAIKKDGGTLMAKDYYKRERKSKSFEDKVRDLTASGIPRDHAEMILKDPVAFYQMMANAQSK